MSKMIPERVIQKSILDYLEMVKAGGGDIYFFRSGVGNVKTESGRMFKTGKAGGPDIIVCILGLFIGFEVKTKSGRQSQAQIDAENSIKKAGGYYYIVRSINDVKEIFRKDFGYVF